MITHLPAVLCALFVALLLLAELRKLTTLKAVAKTGAALSFLAYAVAQGALQAGPGGVAVFAGLVASAVGDVALLSQDRKWFLTGLVAFLLGHVMYIVAFGAIGVRLQSVVFAIMLLALPLLLIWRWLEPHLRGVMRPAVLAYMAVITVMVAGAVGAFYGWPTSSRGGLLVSAVAFYLSDLCVARERFVVRDPRNKIIGLPLYFAAQLGFAGFIAPATVLLLTSSG